MVTFQNINKLELPTLVKINENGGSDANRLEGT